MIVTEHVPWNAHYGSVPDKAGGMVPVSMTEHVSAAVSLLARPFSKGTSTDSVRRVTALPPCEASTCGGPKYCAHRFVPDVSPDVMRDWQVFAVTCPVRDDQLCVPYLARVAAAHLKNHTHPADMVRCGMGATAWAILGVTLRDLIIVERYPLHDVLEHFGGSWTILQMLNFHPTLLQYDDMFPLVVLLKHGLTLSRLMEFPLSYTDLTSTLRCDAHMLCALGVSASQLVALGMTGDDVVSLLRISTGVDAAWMVRAFGFTRALLTRLWLSPSMFDYYTDTKELARQLWTASR